MRPGRLSLDTKKLEQPNDAYVYGKNGVQWMGVNQNEDGFTQSACVVPYKIIGVVETDQYPIYFSTNNTYSAIGFHNLDTDTYVPILDDSTLSYKLNFNTLRPIKGEYRRNYKNVIEVVWIEMPDPTGVASAPNAPRWLDTSSTPSTLNLTNFLLFPKVQIPIITPVMQQGGNLGMGSYFFCLQYISNNGTQTGYTTLTSPLIAFSNNYNTIPGSNTGKSITLTITNVDLSFDRVQLVVVEYINGVYTPYELPELPVNSAITFTYTGAEKGTQLTMTEVLTPSAYYENAQAITQLLDQLFLANMSEEVQIEWQQYANLVKIQWTSTLEPTSFRPQLTTESGQIRGFMHGEVYSFYMVLKLKNGRNSRAFTIPGPNSISGDLANSTYGAAQGLTAPVYAIEDTCRNLSGNTGDCGIWINLDENYPDLPQFDSTSVGGSNLRNQPVRHHKMPSIRYCKQNIYNGNTDYGRAYLDALGINVSNVIIPANLQDKVMGWEIHYAKRDVNNAIVLGQSLLMFGAQAVQDTGNGVVCSTGGNWGAYQKSNNTSSESPTANSSLNLTNNYIRMHPFDLLFNRPSIAPTHIDAQLGLSINFTAPVTLQSDAFELNYELDYTNARGNVNPPALTPANNHIYAIANSQYIVNDSIAGDFSNLRLEAAFVAKLTNPDGVLMNTAKWQFLRMDYHNAANGSPSVENTYLTNICAIRRNVYMSYFSQSLVRTGAIFLASTQNSGSNPVYGGDTFLSVYSFNSYGLVSKQDIVNVTGLQYSNTAASNGIKAIHRFICETVSNVACRYQLPGNQYSAFWPQTNDSGGSNNFLYGLSRDVEPNQIGYSRDCNAVGDQLNGISIASPYDTFVITSPNKVIRSQKQLTSSVINSWKNWIALDYHESVGNKGPIINLQGYNDKLIIHHQNSMFVTRSKATITTDTVDATLGTGDIFQFDPIEMRPAKMGYGGTSNPFACVLTPIGYMFPNNKTGEIFLYDGNQLVNMGEGVVTFLLKYLTVNEMNSFVGNGISIGYDQKFKRLLLTVKNQHLNNSSYIFVPGFIATPAFFATLTPNVSVVYKDGTYQLYKGVNVSAYSCNPTAFPSVPNYNFSSNEHVANGTVIGSVVATGGVAPYTYLITSSINGGLGINPLTGQITIINSSLFDYGLSVLHLTVLVTDYNGNTCTSTVNVTINHVNSTPVMPSATATIPENSVNGTLVATMTATNRDGGTNTYSILSGNTLNAFSINASTGAVSVNAATQLNYFNINPYTLTIGATNSLGNSVTTTLVIYLSFVHQAPIVTNSSVNSFPSLANGSIVATIPPAIQRSGQTGVLQYTLASSTAPVGAYAVNLLNGDPGFLQITMLNNTLPVAGSSYVLTFNVIDPAYPSDISTFTLTIVVSYGNFKLLASYNSDFTSLVGTNIPTFTFPTTVNGTVVKPMTALPGAQTFTVGIATPAITVRLDLVVGGVVVGSHAGITTAGTYSLVLPSAVTAGQDVQIQINT